MGLSVLGKIMKLVTYFFFLSPFTYNLLLVVPAETEWMTEKRQGYFQTFLFQGLRLFRREEYFSRTSENSCAPGRGVDQDVSRSFFLAPESPSFQACVDWPSCQMPPGKLGVFCINYFILCLFYFIFCYWFFFYYSIPTEDNKFQCSI